MRETEIERDRQTDRDSEKQTDRSRRKDEQKQASVTDRQRYGAFAFSHPIPWYAP